MLARGWFRRRPIAPVEQPYDGRPRYVVMADMPWLADLLLQRNEITCDTCGQVVIDVPFYSHDVSTETVTDHDGHTVDRRHFRYFRRCGLCFIQALAGALANGIVIDDAEGGL